VVKTTDAVIENFVDEVAGLTKDLNGDIEELVEFIPYTSYNI
jgi:hypothetical protein